MWGRKMKYKKAILCFLYDENLVKLLNKMLGYINIIHG